MSGLEEKAKTLLLEKLALLEHNQWSEWINCMDKRAIHGKTTVEFTNETWSEWCRKASFHYCDLTEEEKESDRKFARKVLQIRLEDARQEIDNLKTLNDFLNTENLATMKDFCELKKERGEQKKKMNSIFPELDLEDKWHVNPMMNRIREIIKELLKE